MNYVVQCNHLLLRETSIHGSCSLPRHIAAKIVGVPDFIAVDIMGDNNNDSGAGEREAHCDCFLLLVVGLAFNKIPVHDDGFLASRGATTGARCIPTIHDANTQSHTGRSKS
jgi:hypothetical protein